MNKPVVVKEIFNLSNVSGGLQPSSLTFSNIDMQGAKAITIRENISGSGSLVIFNTETSSDIRLPMKDVDSATLNPQGYILALRSNRQIQIYNMELKIRMKTAQVPEDVVYWKWIDSHTITFVTDLSVYHWNIEESEEPKRLFERDAALKYTSVYTYSVDPSQRFCVLIGLKRDGNELVGVAQLYSYRRNASLITSGINACFVPGEKVGLCLSSKTGAEGDVCILALSDEADLSKIVQMQTPLTYANADDFPVAMHILPKYKITCMITRSGMLSLIDCSSGVKIFSDRISDQTIFCAVPNDAEGFQVVNAVGGVLSIKVKESEILQYFSSNLNDKALAASIASNTGLPGGQELVQSSLKDFLDAKDIDNAIKCVLQSPNGALRTKDTIILFTECGRHNPEITPPPISTYYKHILATGKLNEIESYEFTKAVLQRGGLATLKKLIEDEKLEISGELGRIIAPHDDELALRVLHRANEHEKVIMVLLGRGDLSKAKAYCERIGHSPDWKSIVKKCIEQKLDISVQIATMLHRLPGHGGVEPDELVNLFLRSQCIKQLTLYLIEILKGDNPEDSHLHTRLLEINLKHSPPQVAEQIFIQKIVSHFDAQVIAPLCEKAQLHRWAIVCYSKAQQESGHQIAVMKDMKRCMRKLQDFGADWLLDLFGGLSKDDGIELFQELVENGADECYKVTVQIAAKYYSIFGITPLVNIFLKKSAFKSIFFFLGSVKDFSSDPEVHFRYIEAAVHADEIAEVESFTRLTSTYDAMRAKDFLFESSLADARPLINVCDKNDYVQELIKYFVQEKKFSEIEKYVQKHRPDRTPEVVGILLDHGCDEDTIAGLILSVGSMCDSEALIVEVEKRSKIMVLQPWLEQKLRDKSKEVAVYNLLAKIYVNQGKANDFLKSNDLYDPTVIGTYCEKREPQMAFISFSKGGCDADVIRIGFANGLFKELAGYLMKRQNTDLWCTALEKESRDELIDAVLQNELPTSNVPEEVSAIVRALIKANLPEKLTTVLERVVMHGPREFRQNKYLQNLLIITAIKAKNTKAKEYIDQLDGYDASEIARIAITNEEFEVAYASYVKAELYDDAMHVLVDNIQDLDRAKELAGKLDTFRPWAILGEAYLTTRDIAAAVHAFVQSKNTNYLTQIAEFADESQDFQHLVKYIRMVRETNKESNPKLDQDLLYCLAKIGDISELQAFVNTTRVAGAQSVAERCMKEGFVEAACTLFRFSNDFLSLARAQIQIKNLRAAVDSAKKTNSAELWNDILQACIDAKEIELAGVSATHLIPLTDDLCSIIDIYEASMLYDEIISVLHDFVGGANAPMNIFTELTLLYTKYYPEKTFDFVRMYHKRLNRHKVITQCSSLCMWDISCYLYQVKEEWDSATNIMLTEPALTWEHEMLINILNKVSSDDLIDRAIEFYLKYQPLLINELLMGIRNRIDIQRVLKAVQKSPYAFVTRPFLESLSSKNLSSVNTMLIEMLILDSDLDGLKTALENCSNFDAKSIGESLCSNDCQAFRLVGAELLCENKFYRNAMDVYKVEGLSLKVVHTAAQSRAPAIIVEALEWLIDNSFRECFAALAFLSIDALDADKVLEFAYLYGETELLMPFFIQAMADQRKALAGIRSRMGSKDGENDVKFLQNKTSQLLLEQ